MDQDPPVRRKLLLDAAFNTARALLGNTSETASMALAELLIRRYQEFTPEERADFLTYLGTEFGPIRPAFDRALDAYHRDRSEMNLMRLSQAAESQRQQLFRIVNTAAGGTWALVGMRAELLKLKGRHPSLELVEADLYHLLSSWFNRGFIALRRIDWRSPGAVLERLIEYEGVHEIQGWGDLRRRLDADRRCFGFFHPAMPDEPLIFIEVALTSGLADNIQELLNAPRPLPSQDVVADTAIFYSITNCQAGLRGIQLGNFLIKQVVGILTAELPQLRAFATLSPVPGFAAWLRRAGENDELTEAEREVLSLLNEPTWRENPDKASTIQPLLLRACARYLVRAKRGAAPADSVARFHLRNGARIDRINWLGDTSTNGMNQSHGLLVNYVYDIEDIARNHESYVHDGAVIYGPEIARLLEAESPLHPD